jgi:hypothetical protein
MTTSTSSRPLFRALLGATLLATVTPLPAAAQSIPAVSASLTAASAPRCAAEPPAPGSPVARVGEALANPDRERARATLATLHDSLAAAVRARPGDTDTRYFLALVIGGRTEVEGGRTKIQLAGKLHEELVQVLARDPRHAGAQHLLGRLHAGVLRLNSVTRFLAVRLFGASALAGASWDEAQQLLEAAAFAEPCSPDHHFELARLYQDRGRDDLARRELDAILALRIDAARADQVRAKANALIAHLGQ